MSLVLSLTSEWKAKRKMKPRRYAQRRFFSILSTVADQNDVVNRQEGGDAAAAAETDGLIAGFGRQKRRDG